ncbi:MAG: DEAD/DEAH box helicase [Synergistaceae bacterium]|nr:DEAD/DEAH box helicase [Synergistaceae bacterium]
MSALDTIIQSISDSPDKGRLFEKLCAYFLRHDRVQQAQFTDIWHWHDWPGNEGKPDTGIDIVARLRDSESFCAVQCKFRQDDSAIPKSEIDSFLALSSKSIYSARILFALTDNFSDNARNALKDQTPPVRILTLQNLEESSIEWSAFSFDNPGNVRYKRKELLPHQITAVDDVLRGFESHDRGKLIMACGTGKTFTSLKIAERCAGVGGLVLVVVPSISLVNQSLIAWHNDHSENIPLLSFAVCSDSTVGRKSTDEDMIPAELALTPSTNAQDLLTSWQTNTHRDSSMTVIFSTYQSLGVLNDAQGLGLPDFSLVICDEAHRTAGVTPEAKKDSSFRAVHKDSFIRARKRLYMTATPRIFGDTPERKAAILKKADDSNATLYDMEDESVYGPEFHRLAFSKAVNDNLLSDYKVIIFMVERGSPDTPDLAAKIQGAYKALAKDISPVDFDFIEGDTMPMSRAVAFSNKIDDSKRFMRDFHSVITSDSPIACTVSHIDGTMSAARRSREIQRLASDIPPGECRILSNARCLSEGVDVPALDAVIFLSPRSSQIDIVQSVGRVMRKYDGKKYGYVILPVVVQPNETPEHALDNNESYKTVWNVLQALRSHDERFSAAVNSLDLRMKVRVTGGGGKGSWFTDDVSRSYRQEIYIRMVRKCGDREYWSKWAGDMVSAFREISERIESASSLEGIKEEFDRFTNELKHEINPSVTHGDAVKMLAQHITSKEIFDALFSGFSDNNPVSKSMQRVRAVIESSGVNLDPKGLDSFNERVRTASANAKTGAEKQRLLRDIYNNFFRQAFPETADSLGIVYTPEEIVDFIINSADWALRHHLGITEGLSADNVHILDPFSGTGTFTARLIDSGIIPPSRLGIKYQREIHANEMLLLAYYISAVNIEAAFNQVNGGITYIPFPGMVMADTFRLNTEATFTLADKDKKPLFYENGKRAYEEETTEITVIIGNPPYSVGGKNKDYEAVDGKIKDTYVKNSKANHKGSLYDSYIRAIRWASDRMGDKGIICYVTNASFIDSNSADGMRKCIAGEFSCVYIFNLRGNQRGGNWRKEGGKVFGEGSQCPIAITLFVKDERRFRQPFCGYYYESADGMTREEKLRELEACGDFGRMLEAGKMRCFTCNLWGDWVNQRSNDYYTFMALGDKKNERLAMFADRYSMGVKTGQDAWCYNFSREELCRNITRLKPEALTEDSVRVGLYRPYVKECMHFSRETNQRVHQMSHIFPALSVKNRLICVQGLGAIKKFSVLMTDCLPDQHLLETCQCFPLWWYEDGQRRDAISDGFLETFRREFSDDSVTKEDVFCYVYGVLSSREYALRFGNDTKKVLARVPMVRDAGAFREFVKAGRELGDLHVGYETAEMWPVELEGYVSDLRVKRMKILTDKKGGRPVGIQYSEGLAVLGIPESAWEYRVNGRSALAWVVERYRDDADKDSGLRNDCNAWGAEHGNEGYVMDLLRRVVTVSVRTAEILGGLPGLGV